MRISRRLEIEVEAFCLPQMRGIAEYRYTSSAKKVHYENRTVQIIWLRVSSASLYDVLEKLKYRADGDVSTTYP